MTPWNETFSQALNWKIALPKAMRWQNVFVHCSTLLTLPLTALVLLGLLRVAPLDGDWQALAVTLPVVWLASVLIRLVCQWLAVGWQGDNFQFVVGPFGNLSHDYERLPAPTMMLYGGAGQAASLMAAFVGVFALGIVNTSPDSGVTAAALMDFITGFSSSAWASQVVWVNSLLFLVHLLPAVPFDGRAVFIGWCRATNSSVGGSELHRLLSSTDSHLGIGLGSVSVAMLATSLAEGNLASWWAAMLFISAYLLGISHFETLQAQQQADLPQTPVLRASRQRTCSAHSARGYTELVELDAITRAHTAHEILDIDEILRKLHREGQDALSAGEKEALLNASRQLQARRQTRS